MDILKVNGVSVPSPTALTWHLNDISDSAAGRTEDGTMHKNRITQKWTGDLEWQNTTDAETAQILRAFNPEYFDITFENPMTGNINTRTFYRGDQEISVRSWHIGNKIYSLIKFSIIER